MKSIIVKKAQNMDLISYILNIFPSLSKASIYKALRNRDIRVNSEKINKNVILNPSDKLDIYISDNILFNLPKHIDIVYEDDNIIIAYKPQGILSNNENKSQNQNFNEPTFEDLIKNLYKEAVICHRLDRNTSGLIIFAKNNKAYKELLDAFKTGSINKEYIAYVCGSDFKKTHERLEKYILKDKKSGYSKIYDYNVQNSQKIITEYFVLDINKEFDYSILKVIIHTGKTHQIRAQLKAINHPIIGDPKYGKNEINKKFKVYKQLLFAVSYSFNFNPNSCLYYLNEQNIHLNKIYYSDKIGSELNGKK